MPELPDVEGFRRRLQRQGRGRVVEDVIVIDSGVLRNATAPALRRALRGHRLGSPTRHGKWLTAPVDGTALVFHFGMTGEVLWAPSAEGRQPHDRVVLVLDRGELRYRDQRKLQGIWVARGDDVGRIQGRQGPDALDIGAAELRDLLCRRRGELKPALMDQALVAGLGNLLVDEILWQARIDPRRAAASLTDAEHARLHRGLRRVLSVSVREGCVPQRPGWLTSVRARDDAACPRCGRSLERRQTGGRSSYACPHCQRPP